MVGGDGHHGKKEKQLAQWVLCPGPSSEPRHTHPPLLSCFFFLAANGPELYSSSGIAFSLWEQLAQGYVFPRVQLRRNVWLTWGCKGSAPSCV